MRKLLMIVLWATVINITHAQKADTCSALAAHHWAGSYMAYEQPAEALTPPPAGWQPFYISHYGRTGSRHHTKQRYYDEPFRMLAAADSAGALTALGRQVRLRVEEIRAASHNKWGELNSQGAQEQRDIVKRMYEHFRSIFQPKTEIDARSVPMSRCLLSMENALCQLVAMQPRLNIHHNATHRDTYYLNLQDKALMAMATSRQTQKALEQLDKHYADSTGRLTALLFSDTAYARKNIDAQLLADHLFRLAANTESSQHPQTTLLTTLFTPAERCRHWARDNARLYASCGATTLSNGRLPYSQRNLLRKIISDADSTIAAGKPRVQLRYGHSTGMASLCSLLDADSCAVHTDKLETLQDSHWADYRITPMSANIQLVFYRRDNTGKDILVKLLLNEREATLPLPATQAPYYRWDDFRRHYLQMLDDYDTTQRHDSNRTTKAATAKNTTASHKGLHSQDY